MPLTAGTGPITVSTAGGRATSAAKFVVTPGVHLSAPTGSPTQQRTVSFSGLNAFESVDVYFDTTDRTLRAC